MSLKKRICCDHHPVEEGKEQDVPKRILNGYESLKSENLDKALVEFESLTKNYENEEPRTAAACLINAASIHGNQGNMEKAHSMYIQALCILKHHQKEEEQKGDYLLIVVILNLIQLHSLSPVQQQQQENNNENVLEIMMELFSIAEENIEQLRSIVHVGKKEIGPSRMKYNELQPLIQLRKIQFLRCHGKLQDAKKVWERCKTTIHQNDVRLRREFDIEYLYLTILNDKEQGVMKSKELYEKYPDSWDVALCYLDHLIAAEARIRGKLFLESTLLPMVKNQSNPIHCQCIIEERKAKLSL